MFGSLGVPELLIILVIVVVLFGASRVTDIFGGVGKGIREFRKASSGEDEEPSKAEEKPADGKPKA